MPFLTRHQALIDEHVAVCKAYLQNHVSSNLSWCDLSSCCRFAGEGVYELQITGHNMQDEGDPAIKNVWTNRRRSAIPE